MKNIKKMIAATIAASLAIGAGTYYSGKANEVHMAEFGFPSYVSAEIADEEAVYVHLTVAPETTTETTSETTNTTSETTERAATTATAIEAVELSNVVEEADEVVSVDYYIDEDCLVEEVYSYDDEYDYISSEDEYYEEPTESEWVEEETYTPSTAIQVTDYEYIILCNLVAGEYGSDWVSDYDKGAVVATVIHRMWEGTRWTNGADPTIYNVIAAPYQYDGKYLSYGYSDKVTESCKNAVTYALNNIGEYDYYTNPDGTTVYMINSFYGDGTYNWFRCS